MARVMLLAGLVACLFIGGFAATTPSKPSNCSDDFYANLNSLASDISTFTSVAKALDINPGASAVTIFAPTNGAFQDAASKLKVSADPSEWTPEQKLIVTQLIKYHFAPGVLQKTADLTQYGASFKSMANNLPLCKATVNKQDKDNTDNTDAVTVVEDGKKTYSVKGGFNAAKIVTPDLISACLPNTVVHVVDAVLLPCSVDTIAAAAASIEATPIKAAAAPAPKKKTAGVIAATNDTDTTNGTDITIADTTNSTEVNTTTPIKPTKPTTKPTTTKTAGACKGTLAEVVLNVTKDSASQQIAALVEDPTFKGTVFLPSEDAFRTARSTLAASTVNLTDPTILTMINNITMELNMYHVVEGEVVPADVAVETPLDTLLAGVKKQVFCTVTSNGKLTVLPPSATQAELVVKASGNTANVLSSTEACNGIVHKIDAVLLPCPIEKTLLGVMTGATGPTPPGLVTDDNATTGSGTTTTIGTTRSVSNNTNGPTFVPGSTTSNSSDIQSTVNAVKKASGAAAALPSALLAAVAALAALLL